MWYETFLMHLILKVKLSEQKKAEVFLKELLVQMRSIAFPESSIPPPILLGLIDKMYNKYEARDANSVELTDFARDLYSLATIHAKKGYDEDVFLADYPLINKNQVMLEILGYKNYPWEILRSELYKLEYKALTEIDFRLEADLNHFFNILCQQSQQDYRLIEAFILYSFPFAQKNSYYDQFLDQVVLCYGYAMQKLISSDVVGSTLSPQETMPSSTASTSIPMFQFKVLSPIAFFESNKTNYQPPQLIPPEENSIEHVNSLGAGL